MAFTPEQEAAILEFVTKQTAGNQPPAKADDSQEKNADKNKSGDDSAKGKTIAQEAKAAVDAEKNAETALAQIQESVKFNLSINEFVEKNKSLLPDEASKILTTIASKNYASDNEKANILRQGLLDSFLEKKENIDVLTSSMKIKAEQYKALAESDKARRSTEFWDLVEVGVALKQGSRKAEALNKLNGGSAAGSSGNILEDKFMAAAKAKFNNK